jgi:two-component system, OmpR family, heavy metal sensor histidine kinase CusS
VANVGIRGKITLVFLGVFLVTLLPVNFFLFNRVSHSLKRADGIELEAEGNKILDQVRLEPFLMPLPPVGYQIDLYLQREVPPLVNTFFTSPDFVHGQDTLSYAVVQRPEVDGILTIEIARSNQRLQEELTSITRYLLIANLMAVLLASVLIYGVAGLALRPVKQIISVAEKIEASRSFDRVPVPDTGDEYATLARTINGMLSRIENTLRLQTNFFASAAHELKTPLAVMQAELSLALTQMQEKGMQEILSSQLRELERLHQTIQDFLLVSQLKTETVVVRKKEYPVEEVIYAAVKRLKYLLAERETKLKLMLPDKGETTLLMDVDKTEIVVVNLIENALKYSVPGSEVSISLQNHSHEVWLIVSNPIMTELPPVEELRQEFTKSQELSSGLGMGLWISDRLSTLQGFTLDLSKESGWFKATLRLSK